METDSTVVWRRPHHERGAWVAALVAAASILLLGGLHGGVAAAQERDRGQSDERREDAPGQSQDQGRSEERREDAPGQSQDQGRSEERREDAPGQSQDPSEDAPGRSQDPSADAPGRSEDRSDGAPGQTDAPRDAAAERGRSDDRPAPSRTAPAAPPASGPEQQEPNPPDDAAEGAASEETGADDEVAGASGSAGEAPLPPPDQASPGSANPQEGPASEEDGAASEDGAAAIEDRPFPGGVLEDYRLRGPAGAPLAFSMTEPYDVSRREPIPTAWVLAVLLLALLALPFAVFRRPQLAVEESFVAAVPPPEGSPADRTPGSRSRVAVAAATPATAAALPPASPLAGRAERSRGRAGAAASRERTALRVVAAAATVLPLGVVLARSLLGGEGAANPFGRPIAWLLLALAAALLWGGTRWLSSFDGADARVPNALAGGTAGARFAWTGAVAGTLAVAHRYASAGRTGRDALTSAIEDDPSSPVAVLLGMSPGHRTSRPSDEDRRWFAGLLDALDDAPDASSTARLLDHGNRVMVDRQHDALLQQTRHRRARAAGPLLVCFLPAGVLLATVVLL
jgi:hypothetical protein